MGLLTEAEFFVAFRDNLLAWEAFVNALLADGEQATTPAGRERALADAMVSFDQWDITRLLMLAFTAAPEGDPTRPQWVAFNAEAKARGIATRARLGRLARAHMLAFDDQCRTTRSLAAAEDELRTVIRNEAYMPSLEEAPSPDRDTLPPMPLDDYRALGRAFPTRAEFCVRTDILDVTSTAVQVAQPGHNHRPGRRLLRPGHQPDVPAGRGGDGRRRAPHRAGDASRRSMAPSRPR